MSWWPCPICCSRHCGCWEQVQCFPRGDRLVATSISSSATGGCDALNGIVKYFTWNEIWWEADHDTDPYDDGYHPCIHLNDGIHTPARLICDDQHVTCPEEPDDPPCFSYKLILNAPQCGGTDPLDLNGICPDECDCDPFYLRFNGIPFNGGPQGPFSGGLYTFLCDCVDCWDELDPQNVLVDWVFSREYSCCCPNLDKPTAPQLQATIDSDAGEGPCGGTMEGAYALMNPTTSGGTDCKIWESGNITFQCSSGDTHTLKFSMECEGQIEQGFCCWDYVGTISWPAGSGNDACCDAADADVQQHALNTCECYPPFFRFGPYRLWKADPDAECCECCEEFWIVVTEAPS